ncbi:MAG: DUF1565 domain-containing protein [Cyanobacteria bacterium J06598_3]
MPNKPLLSKRSNMAAALAAGAALLLGPVSPAFAETTIAQAAGTSQVIAAGTTAKASYQTLHVNPTAGDDSAQGLDTQPLKTVTKALEMATPNTVIVLASGRYTQATGEVFPLQLKSGVTIQGTPGDRNRTAIIEGGGNFQSPLRSQQNAAIIATDRAGIAQVAISNPDGYGVWVESASPTILETAFVGSRQTGLYVAGGSPRVENSYFSGNQVAGLIVLGTSRASIRDNIFDGTGDAIRVVDGATPNIVGNRMTNNEAGLVIIGNARPILRDNHITGNRRNDVVEVTASAQDIASPTALTLAEDSTRPGDGTVSSVASQATRTTASTTDPTAVPEAADAVPGERVGSFSLSPLHPTVRMASNPSASRSIQLRTNSRSRVPEPLPELEADAIPGLVSASTEAVNDVPPGLSAAAPTAVEPTPIAAAPTSPLSTSPLSTSPIPELPEPAASPRRNLLSRSSTSSSPPTEVPIAVVPAPEPPTQSRTTEPLVEADALEADALPAQANEQPAGAPGAALAAIRSGVPIASRAVSDGNPDSFRIRGRRRRPTADPQPEVRPTAPVSPSGNSNRLAVPSSDIPIGSGGSSVIFSAPRSGVGAPPSPPSRAQALGLYFRVFVETSDPFVEDDVKNVVPDAFRTSFEGRSVMQVGAFPTEDEAEDRRRLLEDNGLDVRVEYIR